MEAKEAVNKKPLWLSIEEKLLELDSPTLSGADLEAAVHRVAGELDNSGYNVSRHGGHLLELRWAIDDMRKVGRPLLKDFNDAVAALSLEDIENPFSVADRLIGDMGETWPDIKKSERRGEIIRILEATRLDLLIAKAKALPDDKGVRLLIEEEVAPDVIIERLDITKEMLDQVNARIKQERAERARVATLLEAVQDKPDPEKIKYLMTNNVSEELIIEMAGVDSAAIDGAKQAMEAELKEKQRLEEEAAARKKEEAAGPPLEKIPPDQMLEYIEAIREILEFSDQEKDIRVMCEQSSIPKSLVDVAVSDPKRLDELEKQAEA